MKNLAVFIGLALGLAASVSQASENSTNPGYVYHVVAFRYNPETTLAQRNEIAQRFLALQSLCKRNGRPYVLSVNHGAFSSPEGADREVGTNYPDTFVVTFKSANDRDYYVGRLSGPGTAILKNADQSDSYDPAHDAFKAFVGPYLDVLRDGNGQPVLDKNGAQQTKGVFVYDMTTQ